MASKKNQDTDSDNSTSTSSSSTTQPQQSGKKGGMILYIALIGIIIIVVALAYFALSSLSGSGSNASSKSIYANLTNSSLNQTQLMFVRDLELSNNVSSIHVSYYNSNESFIPESSNLTVAVVSNQTINSYKMGNQNQSTEIDVVAYENSKTNQVLQKNVTGLYYYNTSSQTLTCVNETSYALGPYALGVSNSSLQCSSGDYGLSFLEGFPYRVANVSYIALLAVEGNLTYKGTSTILGRTCDNFFFSNATSSNFLSNYSVASMCIDKQYGIPLYFNETEIAGGVQYPILVIRATSISTNVSQSNFNIPQAYIDNTSTFSI